MAKVAIEDLIELFGEIIDISKVQVDINAVLGRIFPLILRICCGFFRALSLGIDLGLSPARCWR